MIEPLQPPTLETIRAARGRISSAIFRTPLVRLNVDTGPAEVWLKLENLQPVCSFKIRGAANAVRRLSPEQLRDGVYTASAGNMAQGVALSAKQMGAKCTVVVPDRAPATKLDAIARLGGEIIKTSYDNWWRIMMEHRFDGVRGTFIHPVANADVVAGNATVGLEIIEDLPDVDTVLAPYGGGGLSCGIASALRALKPDVRVIPCESSANGPYTASLAAGKAVEIAPTPSFVDGIGGKSVLPEMWPMAHALMPEARMVTVDEIAAAIRLLVERNRVIAEGAGAAPVAVALAGNVPGKKIVCVISGGNLDITHLRTILDGRTPVM